MMHHSQLEYLVAVQKLQRQDRGAKGYEVAEYLNVSPAYAVKLNVYAESQGYVPVSYTHLTLPTNREV